MYRGNKQEKHPKRRKKANRRIGILILSLLLIAAAAIGGTMAYLTAENAAGGEYLYPCRSDYGNHRRL